MTSCAAATCSSLTRRASPSHAKLNCLFLDWLAATPQSHTLAQVPVDRCLRWSAHQHDKERAVLRTFFHLLEGGVRAPMVARVSGWLEVGECKEASLPNFASLTPV